MEHKLNVIIGELWAAFPETTPEVREYETIPGEYYLAFVSDKGVQVSISLFDR